MNISEHLKIARDILQSGGVSEPSREAASLLAFVLQKDKVFLIAYPEYELSAEEEKRFYDVVTRRAGREPFQYIVGKQEFYGLDFEVTNDVLIPRPETEMIVGAAIDILRENGRFCEVGIGSGCIAVSILHSVKTAVAVGLDISESALKVAKINAETHRVLNRLELKLSDVFESLQNEQFDLIISNPPYIPVNDIKSLQSEVGKFEPLSALTDGSDGLSIIKKLIIEAPLFLQPNGYLLMEIGINQSIEVEKMFTKNCWETVEILPDFQEIPRMVKAKKCETRGEKYK